MTPPVTPPSDEFETSELSSARLVLEPLRVEHADEMAGVLADPQLHTYIGGLPATLDELRDAYSWQVRGRSADGSERWLNWIIRRRDDGRAAGYVQATVTWEAGAGSAEVAWVVGTDHQGLGFAQEASLVMTDWLRGQGIRTVVAHVHPDHGASIAVARRIGLAPTDEVVDGEIRWQG